MPVDLDALLNLYFIDGIGTNRLRTLINKFKNVDAIHKASEQELSSINGIDVILAKRIKSVSNLKQVRAQKTLAQNFGARIITLWDSEYPEMLKNIYDPPAILFVKGSLKKADKSAIAIVGTRTPTNYGKYFADKFSRELSLCGFTIASGMARGIDTLAHWAAIKSSGRTIAVLGSGIDVIYPSENKNLYHQITENGAIISEFLMGTKPDASNFPRRNRIVSGLSLGLLVVEAGLKSGALITANLALEQNREIFAVPGNINSAKSHGCNQLIADGAKLVSATEEIVNELQPQLNTLVSRERVERKIVSLNPTEKIMLENLNTEAIHIDKIAKQNKITISQALGVLLSLELKELVRQLPGKYFVRI